MKHAPTTPPLDAISLRLAGWLRDPLPTDSGSWPSFAHDAGVRGLAGLVLERSLPGATLSAETRTELDRFAARTAFNNVHALRQVSPVIDALDRADIPVMLLKGAALLTTVYDRLDLRPMSDVDLLVHPEHASRAVAIMQSTGCRRGAALLREDFFPRFHYEVELFVPGPRPVRLDLHARPFRPMRLSRTMPDDALWDSAVAVDVHGARAFVPCPELFLIQLAGHAAFHGCSRLIWLYDLVRLVRTYGNALDWELVLRRCEEWRLGAAVGLSLRLAQDLLGPFVPTNVLTQMSAQPTNWRDRLVLRQTPRDAQSPWRHVLANLLCTPGLGFRFAYGMSLLTPDAAHLQSNATNRRALLQARLRRILQIVSRPMRRLVRRAVPQGRIA